MNTEETKRIIPLIQAFTEGKLQVDSVLTKSWLDVVNLDIYRVKPEPRRWWVNVHSTVYRAYVTRGEANLNADWDGCPRQECVEVMEVIK